MSFTKLSACSASFEKKMQNNEIAIIMVKLGNATDFVKLVLKTLELVDLFMVIFFFTVII